MDTHRRGLKVILIEWGNLGSGLLELYPLELDVTFFNSGTTRDIEDISTFSRPYVARSLGPLVRAISSEGSPARLANQRSTD